MCIWRALYTFVAEKEGMGWWAVLACFCWYVVCFVQRTTCTFQLLCVEVLGEVTWYALYSVVEGFVQGADAFISGKVHYSPSLTSDTTTYHNLHCLSLLTAHTGIIPFKHIRPWTPTLPIFILHVTSTLLTWQLILIPIVGFVTWHTLLSIPILLHTFATSISPHPSTPTLNTSPIHFILWWRAKGTNPINHIMEGSIHAETLPFDTVIDEARITWYNFTWLWRHREFTAVRTCTTLLWSFVEVLWEGACYTFAMGEKGSFIRTLAFPIYQLFRCSTHTKIFVVIYCCSLRTFLACTHINIIVMMSFTKYTNIASKQRVLLPT